MAIHRTFAALATLALLLAASVTATCPARADFTDLIGAPAPAIRARPLGSDESVHLEQFHGRVVVLAFVATWCSACRRAAPRLEELADSHEGVTVLALTYEGRDEIRAHVQREPRRYRTLQCTGHTAVSYGADALPTLVVVDRQGRVAAAYQGASPSIMESLRRDVERLL